MKHDLDLFHLLHAAGLVAIVSACGDQTQVTGSELGACFRVVPGVLALDATSLYYWGSTGPTKLAPK